MAKKNQETKKKKAPKKVSKKTTSKKTDSTKTASVKKADVKKTSAPKTLTQKPLKIQKRKRTYRKKKASQQDAANLSARENREKWNNLKEKYKEEKIWPYNMNNSFESKKVIRHKEFGLGIIISQYNSPIRLKVHFENGIKVLISNLKKKSEF